MIDDKNLSEQQRETINIINDSGEHLLNLINDVLDISKIEAGKVSLSLESFSLHTMLNSIDSMFRLKAEEKKLALHINREDSVPDMVTGDRNKVRQILVNLLGNAVKFTDSGEINVDIRSDKNSAGHCVEFAIRDTGQGVAKEDYDKIFSVFGQSRAGETTQNSTGLGLAISRQFARLMGGDITLHSNTQPGSTFTFSVPLSPGESQKSYEHQIVTGIADQEHPRILVVDDIRNNRLLIDRMLSPLGFELAFAGNGQEALDQIPEFQPELILMDVLMPVMDGIEATQAIKNNPQWQAIPVIALTASVFENQRLDTIQRGADGFLKKPLIQADLLGTIAEKLNIEYSTMESSDAQDKPKAATKSDAQIELAKATQPQILIVDDTKVNRIVARGFLNKRGYYCIEADSGAQALEILEHELPQLVLMDRYMPGMDGVETISAMRQNPHTADIPVAIFSSEDRDVDREKLLALNVTEYVNKPIDQKELLLLIDKYVNV